MPRARRSMIAASFLVAFLHFGTGCAKQPDEQPQPEAAVDPRFASASSVLEYYNSITTHEPVDTAAVYAICYAENEFQRRYVAASMKMGPFAELDRLMFQRFGECFNPKKRSHMLSPDKPATMIREDAQRAEAKLIDSEGDAKTLHLVRIGDRWWVSGYTFEYEPDIAEYKKNMDGLERLTNAIVAATPSVVTGIQNGEIKTAAQARDALNAAMKPPAGT